MSRLPRKLVTRHRKFAESYAIHLNATQAAKDAGYSADTAYSKGPQLLKKIEVQALVAQSIQDSGITKARTLREIARLAYSDPGELFDEYGNLKPIHTLPEHVRSTIASVEVIKRNLVSGDGELDEVHKVKQWDKTKALEMAGKYLKLFDDKSGDTNIAIQVTWMQAPGSSSEPINVTPERRQVSETSQNDTAKPGSQPSPTPQDTDPR